MESEEFKKKWYCDVKTLSDRLNFIEKEWEYIVQKYPQFGKILKRPILSLKFISAIAILKPITDEDLFNTVWANIEILYVNKSERTKKEFYQNLNIPFDIVFEFTNTPEYKKMLVEREVTGDDSLQLGIKTVKISHKVILQHIDRIKAKPILSKEILDVQDDWESFIKKRHETKINKS